MYKTIHEGRSWGEGGEVTRALICYGMFVLASFNNWKSGVPARFFFGSISWGVFGRFEEWVHSPHGSDIAENIAAYFCMLFN